LIDFGLATKPSADKTTYQEFYQSIYYLWPLDMILISEKPGVKEMSRSKLMNHIREFRNVDNHISRFYDYMYNDRNLYDALRMAEQNEMKLRERGIYNIIISKVDVYSIGCLLLEMSLMYREFQEPLRDLLIETGILAPIAMERVSSTELYEQYMAKFSHLF
jgi:serine/threonine protein kinase